MTLLEMFKEATSLSVLYCELDGDLSCTTIYCDNQSLRYASRSIRCSTNEQVDIRHHYIRYVIAQGNDKLTKIGTNNNLRDMMTCRFQLINLNFVSILK